VLTPHDRAVRREFGRRYFRSLGHRWAIASFVALALLPAAAGAQDAVVLVDADPALEDALAVTLAPWGTDVRAVPGESPGSMMPGSAERGRALSEAHRALAVVWVSRSDDGFAIWIYDARHDRAIARPLPNGPPFDGATAAEVALMVKTLLRHGPVAPEAAPDAAAPETAPLEAALFWLSVSGGPRFFATAPDAVDARFGLSLSFWPRELESHLGIGLRAVSGPGIAVSAPRLSGHFTDTELSIFVAGRVAIAGPLELAGAAVIGVHLTTLEGRVDPAQRASELRADAIVGADAELAIGLDRRVRLALVFGTTLPLNAQRYFVGPDLALEVSRANLSVTLALGVGLP
jgi:hypothetical protein